MSIRVGHEWYCGTPGSWDSSHLKKLAGRWIACPGCTIDAFTQGNCHTSAIIEAFKKEYPVLEPPKFVSASTKCVEGKGGLRDILISRDAVFAGCKPPRGAPTSRELGVSLPASIFGNPEIWAQINAKRLQSQEARDEKKREAKYGKGPGVAYKRDLPDLTKAEAETQRRACFDKAWAQKRAREEKEKKREGKKQA